MVELTQDKLDLIEKIIKNNRKFSNNEDLYDDFFNETCKRSLEVMKVISSGSVVEPYLKKVATTSILNVLKDAGRLRRSREGYTPVREVPLDTAKDYSAVEVSYDNFLIEKTPEDIVIEKDILSKIANLVYEIDKEEPEKQYLQIYKLRYQDGMTQNEIANDLGLSQSEVSKRLFKLMKKIKQSLV